MKRFLLYTLPLFCFLLKSCLRKYDTAEFEIHQVHLSPATTASNNGMPYQTNDPILRKLFALEVRFDISDNLSSIDFDSYESSIINKTEIDSVYIWSDQVFSGTPVGQGINKHFYLLEEYYSTATRLESGIPVSILRRNNKTPYYSKIYFVCDSDPDSGNYKFYSKLYLSNGTILTDSTELTILE